MTNLGFRENIHHNHQIRQDYYLNMLWIEILDMHHLRDDEDLNEKLSYKSYVLELARKSISIKLEYHNKVDIIFW